MINCTALYIYYFSTRIFPHFYSNYQVSPDIYNIYAVLSGVQREVCKNTAKDTCRHFCNFQYNQNLLTRRFLSAFLLCCGMSTYSLSPSSHYRYIINISIRSFYISEMLPTNSYGYYFNIL